MGIVFDHNQKVQYNVINKYSDASLTLNSYCTIDEAQYESAKGLDSGLVDYSYITYCNDSEIAIDCCGKDEIVTREYEMYGDLPCSCGCGKLLTGMCTFVEYAIDKGSHFSKVFTSECYSSLIQELTLSEIYHNYE